LSLVGSESPFGLSAEGVASNALLCCVVEAIARGCCETGSSFVLVLLLVLEKAKHRP
jgi:hypothetical protein